MNSNSGSKKIKLTDTQRLALFSVMSLGIFSLVCWASFEELMKGDFTGILMVTITAFFTLPVPVLALMSFSNDKGLRLPTESLWLSLQYLGVLGRLVRLNYLELTGLVGRIENCLNNVQYKQAEKLADQALSLRTNESDVSQQGIVTVTASMAAIVQSRLSNNERALTLIDKYISPVWEKFNKNNTPGQANDLAMTLNTVGCVMDDLNRPELGLKCYEHSLHLKKVADQGDIDTNTANVGYANLCVGNLELAEKYLKETLENLKKHGKLNSTTFVPVSANLAECLVEQNKFEEAAPHIWASVERAKKLFVHNNPYRARGLVTAGRILAHEGKLEQARDCFEEADAVCLASVGSDHFDTAYTRKHFAVFLRSQNENARAEEMERTSKATFDRLAQIEIPERLWSLIDKTEEQIAAEAIKDMEVPATADGAPQIELTAPDKSGMHPVIAQQLKIYNPNIISYLLIAYVGFLVMKDGFEPGMVFVLAFLALLLVFPNYRAAARLKSINKIIYGGQKETATVKLDSDKGPVRFKYSGTIDQCSIPNFTGKKLIFNFPGLDMQSAFNGIPTTVHVFTDAKNKKIVALNTIKGLLVVDNKWDASLNPIAKLAVSCIGIIGFTTVAMLAFVTLGLSLSETVPEGKTAQEYYDLGSRYKNAGWTEQSRDCLDRASKMDPAGFAKKADLFKRTKLPRHPVPKEAIEMNVKGYNSSNRFTQSKSEEIWKECIKKYPDFEWPYSNLGSLYLEQNKLDEADKLLSKAIELNPDYVNALLFEAEVKRKQKKFDEANVLLDKVLELEPDNAKAKMQRALPRI